MTEEMRKMNLQLFADGSGDGGDDLEDPTVDIDDLDDGDDLGGDDDDSSKGGSDDFDPEKYISRDEAGKATSARINELKRKYEPYEQMVKRLQAASGMTLDQIDAYLNQQTGGGAPSGNYPDPRYVQQANTAQAAAKLSLETRRMVEEQTMSRNPLYSDYDQVKDEVREVADNLGIELEKAYWVVNGQNRTKSLEKDIEKRVLANINKKRGLGAEGDGAVLEHKKLGLTAEEVQFAQKAGMDPKEYAALKGVVSLEQYEKLG